MIFTSKLVHLNSAFAAQMPARVLKMSRTIKNEQLYIQEEHNMFINPSPLIPLPSVSFQCNTFRMMLVRVRADLNS